MMDEARFQDKLTKNITSLSNRIESKPLYKIKNYIIYMLLRLGIGFDYALPFIVSLFISIAGYYEDGKTIFPDIVVESEEFEMVDMSNGWHQEYDVDYSTSDMLEYSTGWKRRKNTGLYERTVTTYQVSESFKNMSVSELLLLSKEELDDMFVITNVQTIGKSRLSSEEDSMFYEDAVIVTTHEERVSGSHLETDFENSVCFLKAAIVTFAFTWILELVQKIIFRNVVRDNLKKIAVSYRPISRKELQIAKQILELRKENLRLLSGESASLEEGKKSYQLRKDLGDYHG